MKHLIILVLSGLIFFSNLTLKSQALIHYSKTIKPDYCLKDSIDVKDVIGRPVKIWHEGGVFSTLDMSKKIKWPSEEIRKRGGQSGWGTFEPKAGDTGIVTHIFTEKSGVNKYIYLLKIQGNYVPVACSYITSVDLLDSHKQYEQDWINDSINNVNYAAGCKFKIRNVNNSWSRAGLNNIDKQSEDFACSLIKKGIDTIMLCKYIFDNGSLPGEKGFILWIDNGQGYVKSYFNNASHEPTNNKAMSFDSRDLIDYFFINRLDTVTSTPKSEIWISHSLGYSIQLYVPGFFYRERLTDFIIKQDTTHPKSIWWNMISEKLMTLKQE
ncbi:hypothetical protein [Chitinophaga pinensis]|uniref:Uncharacterized protein n=1 Tax=Chitinophaga pinensis (strain ATCC 43595 / DSM 2588 / LMG 13176 / NBRC 15968 / NCIMB 11800 / UQM 2034) TaxID=485918 RepID=A0A979G495_CHIPD|nr:hypothetical protein [Chitinophaga pinensis]ACU60368.1 hypothetical protein Cpin_2889 [Chitinophaga pinensis DSM 2588]